ARASALVSDIRSPSTTTCCAARARLPDHGQMVFAGAREPDLRRLASWPPPEGGAARPLALGPCGWRRSWSTAGLGRDPRTRVSELAAKAWSSDSLHAVTSVTPGLDPSEPTRSCGRVGQSLASEQRP